MLTHQVFLLPEINVTRGTRGTVQTQITWDKPAHSWFVKDYGNISRVAEWTIIRQTLLSNHSRPRRGWRCWWGQSEREREMWWGVTTQCWQIWPHRPTGNLSYLHLSCYNSNHPPSPPPPPPPSLCIYLLTNSPWRSNTSSGRWYQHSWRLISRRWAPIHLLWYWESETRHSWKMMNAGQ